MSANQERHVVDQGDQGRGGKESEVLSRDEFGELNAGDPSNAQAHQQERENIQNAQAHQQERENLQNAQDQSRINIDASRNMAPNEVQENHGANQGAQVNDGRHDGRGNDGIRRSFRGRGGFGVARGRGG